MELDSSFTAGQKQAAAAAAEPWTSLEVHTHSLTRRGYAHANEDRLATLDLATLMSSDAALKFLEGSEQVA